MNLHPRNYSLLGASLSLTAFGGLLSFWFIGASGARREVGGGDSFLSEIDGARIESVDGLETSRKLNKIVLSLDNR